MCWKGVIIMGILHRTAVAKVLRSGALPKLKKQSSKGAVRLSKEAIQMTIDATEEVFKSLGQDGERVLGIAKKKTLQKDMLIDIVEAGGDKYTWLAINVIKKSSIPGNKKGTKEKPAKHKRSPIARKSARNALGLGMDMNTFRISKDVQYALSDLAEDYIKQMGKRAVKYTNAGNRSTISKSDIEAALED